MIREMKKMLNCTRSSLHEQLVSQLFHLGKYHLGQYNGTRSSYHKEPSRKDTQLCKVCCTYVAVGCHKVLGESHKRMKSYAIKQLCPVD